MNYFAESSVIIKNPTKEDVWKFDCGTYEENKAPGHICYPISFTFDLFNICLLI
jgi:hypothetical protein